MSCQSLSIEHNAVTKVPIGILSQAAELVSQSALLWSPDSVFDVFSVILFFFADLPYFKRQSDLNPTPWYVTKKLYCVLPLCIHTHIHVYVTL